MARHVDWGSGTQKTASTADVSVPRKSTTVIGGSCFGSSSLVTALQPWLVTRIRVICKSSRDPIASDRQVSLPCRCVRSVLLTDTR